ncbi:DHA2 family efflux MFS transporter permease subunit [Streptomyces sp. Root1310]|uniref:DHA2 family efflux MFS transporter permease subunit n=1 Tax=Streptomyces sp. Root1310 TaxID=1736452 RepID=UPI000AD52604|nr:DHA2 family efflux MFS transporter permease subunit [Streptomyces sp. Root1310]
MTNEDSRRWWALAAIGLSLLTVSVDATILNVALPTVSTELGASTSDLQWFVDAFTLAMAALLLPAGLLGDRLGRKTMLMASLFLFGLASLWCAYSGSAGMLIAARTVLGISAAFLVPLCTSVLLDIFEGEHERAKAIGVIAVTQSLGLPLGPIIGGALLNHFWWGSVFLINVPLVAVGLLAVARLVPSSRGSQHGAIDLLGVLLSSVGLVALVYGAIEAGERGWSDPQSLLPLIGGLALLVVFVLWEVRVAVSRDPLLDLSLFRSAGFVWGSILGTVVSFAMFGLIFALPQYFQAVDGTDALGTGLRLLPLIGGVLVSAAVIRSSPEAAPRAVPTAGFVLVAIGLFMGTRTSLSTDYGFVALWLVITGLGLGLAMTRTMAAAVNSLSKERSGVGSAVVSALRQVGGAVGVAVLGTIANASYRSHLTLPGLPDDAKEAARRSVGAGVAVGEQLGSPAVVRSVQDAFVHAMQSLLAVCGGIAVVAAVLALLFMPKRAAGTEPHSEGDEQGSSALRKAA